MVLVCLAVSYFHKFPSLSGPLYRSHTIILLYQAMKAKAITEGKVHGPRAKQQQLELEGPVEYEPFDFPDGEIDIHIHVHIYNERN